MKAVSIRTITCSLSNRQPSTSGGIISSGSNSIFRSRQALSANFMINKTFEVNKADVSNLISNEVREGRTLDYKEALPAVQTVRRRNFSLTSPRLPTPQVVTSFMEFRSGVTVMASRPESLKLPLVWRMSMLTLKFCAWSRLFEQV